MTEAQQLRFKQLRELDEQVNNAILGHPVEDRRELLRLQKRVRAEIRNFRAEVHKQLEPSTVLE